MYTKYICDFSPSSGEKPARQSAHFNLISASIDLRGRIVSGEAKPEGHNGDLTKHGAIPAAKIVLFPLKEYKAECRRKTRIRRENRRAAVKTEPEDPVSPPALTFGFSVRFVPYNTRISLPASSERRPPRCPRGRIAARSPAPARHSGIRQIAKQPFRPRLSRNTALR